MYCQGSVRPCSCSQRGARRSLMRCGAVVDFHTLPASATSGAGFGTESKLFIQRTWREGGIGREGFAPNSLPVAEMLRLICPCPGSAVTKSLRNAVTTSSSFSADQREEAFASYRRRGGGGIGEHFAQRGDPWRSSMVRFRQRIRDP